MIKSKTSMMSQLEIDLTGPDGNAFVLIGFAKSLSRQLGKDTEDIVNRMTSSDYENLITVFEEEFGEYVTLYR